MSTVEIAARPRKTVVSAVIVRADGTVEDLGPIAYWHRNPLFRSLGSSLIRMKEICRGFARSE